MENRLSEKEERLLGLLINHFFGPGIHIKCSAHGIPDPNVTSPHSKSSLLPIVITQTSICRAQCSPKPRHIKNCLSVRIPCAEKPQEL